MIHYEDIRDFTTPLGVKNLNDTLRRLWDKVANIDTKDLRNNSITTVKIIDRSIVSEKIAEAAIDSAHIKEAAIESAHIKEANITEALIENGAITNAKIQDGTIENAKIKDGTITSAKIGSAEIEEANILDGSITNAKIADATIESAKIKEGAILNAHILDGTIGSAKIMDLSADKLTAGEVDLNVVNLAGENGRLKIINNKIQVFDGLTELFERIAIGDIDEDGSKYGMRIRGVDGTTTLFDETGLTDEGFTDGYNKLTDDSLDPRKLDIAQTVTRINDGETTINYSKIMGDSNTLDVEFGSIVETVDGFDTRISDNTAKLEVQADEIEARVTKGTFESDMSGVNSRLSTAEGQISVNADGIALRATKTELSDATNQVIQTLTTEIDAKVGLVDVRVDTLNDEMAVVQNHFSFADDLRISQAGSNTQVSLSHEALQFLSSGGELEEFVPDENAVGYISGVKVYFKNMQADTLIAGNHMQEKYGDKLTLIKWVGGVN